MASNPPFQVEDQTDDDFFDKLVDDDDELNVGASSVPACSSVDGNDSDELKVFANLSIGEVTAGEETSGNANGVSADGHVEQESSSSPVSSNLFTFDSVVESNSGAIGKEESLDSKIGNIDGSVGSGVKEVQWTAFNADSEQNGGFGSYSDFFTELGDGAVNPTGKVEDNFGSDSKVGYGSEEVKTSYVDNGSYNSRQYDESQSYNADMGQIAGEQDVNSSEYWENLYPGWKYDMNTGQWYQVAGYDATGNVQGNFDSNSVGDWALSDGNSEVSYLQQTAQSVVGNVTESSTTESVSNWNQFLHESGTTESVTNWNQVSQESESADGVSNWNQVSQGNNEYPAHMHFDPQYPGWYYDTIAQEWRSLETYTSSVQSTVPTHDQPSQNGFASTATSSHDNEQKTCVDYSQTDNYKFQGFDAQNQDYNWAGSVSNYNQQGLNTRQPQTVSKSEAPIDFSGNQHLVNDYGSKLSVNNHLNQQNSYASRGTDQFYGKGTQGHNNFMTNGSPGFIPSENVIQQVNNKPSMQQKEQMHVSNNYYGNQNSVNFPQQQFQGSHQFSPAADAGRSSAGRPPHALVTFGFGGKLVVMKDSSSFSTSSYGSQGPLGGSISVLNLLEIVTQKIDASSIGVGTSDYFSTLCRQSFPGPLVGGNVGSKDLNRWIDERIVNCESHDMDYRKGHVLKLLFSLLKIACQCYGKLRSPFGSDSASVGSDVPELAVARLFSSAKGNGAQFSDYGALARSLQELPSEAQLRATAAEVQSLLVSGRKKEALHCASEGQLWGPALVLAAQLGDQFYVDTVKQMALRQLVAGSPLRTLCLLIAGQPADVFSTDTTFARSIPGAMNMSPQPSQGSNCMLNDWEENLAVITANRTKDDELVLIHLGDCLWKDRSEIIAAHICYLVAEANFEPYSDSARLCLIGADHWKFPRTYASPDAIQRTELYEYSKMLGNPQFVLLPFQPYKLIYAHMLAEVGKVTESLKYCQAVLKYLKTGRAPEVDTWRQLVSSLEERIRTHQQGGYSTNLAPAKLVGRLLNLFDSTAHRVVGGLPPPAPSASQGAGQANEHYYKSPRVSTSQSTMAMSSLVPSASMEHVSQWTADGNRMTMHNRSVSEPDFGKTPIQDQVELSKEATSSSRQGKASALAGTSRFGRLSFSSQLFQKTVGLVLKPRQDKQAKLGDTNKFYYDEKLKRWVEEGVEAPAEEAAPPPPPTTATFQNGVSDYSLKSALKGEGSASNGSPNFTSPTPLDHISGIPPIPHASNQFSARGRTGVRSRYVDTFNKGGGNPTNLFQSPLIPSAKPAISGNPKIFVPTPVSSSEQTFDTVTDSVQETTAITENSSTPNANNSVHYPAPLSSMQRTPSMGTISNNETMMNSNDSLSSHSRRTASWSGSFNNAYSPPQTAKAKPLGEVMGIQPSLFLPSESSLGSSGGSIGEDLHEVEL